VNGYKVHHGLPLDAKLAVIARRAGLRRGEILALWIALLDYASQNMPRGSIKDIDAEEIAIALEFEPAAVETALQSFRDKGMVSAGETLTAWEKSQKLSSTLRTREHRARRRQQETMPKKQDDDNDSEEEISRRRQRLRGEVLDRHKKRGRTIVKQP